MPIPGLGTWFASLILIGGLIFVVLFLITAFASKSLAKASIIWGGLLGGFLVFCIVGATWDKISRNIEENKQEKRLKAFLAKSEPYFNEKCKSAGVFIYEKDIPSQESVYIMKPFKKEFLDGENLQFIEHDFFNHPINRSRLVSKGIEGLGWLVKSHRCQSLERCDVPFDYVEIYHIDSNNLIRIENLLDSNGYNREAETPINSITSHYGITWKDISTKEDRGHWVAGGKRQIIDLKNNKVIAEAIGYVMFADPYDLGYTPWERVKTCPENYRQVDFVLSILRHKEFLEYQLTKEKK